MTPPRGKGPTKGGSGQGSGQGSGRSLHTRVKTARGRKQSSRLWLERQLNDPYVRQAKAEGYASRAAYKLEELLEKIASTLGEAFEVEDQRVRIGSHVGVYVVDPDERFVLSVDRVEVRRIVIAEVHVDDDPVELAQSRHLVNLVPPV